jgi:hypothetical protein
LLATTLILFPDSTSNDRKTLYRSLTHFVPRTSACSFAEFYSVDRARARARS